MRRKRAFQRNPLWSSTIICNQGTLYCNSVFLWMWVMRVLRTCSSSAVELCSLNQLNLYLRADIPVPLGPRRIVVSSGLPASTRPR